MLFDYFQSIIHLWLFSSPAPPSSIPEKPVNPVSFAFLRPLNMGRNFVFGCLSFYLFFFFSAQHQVSQILNEMGRMMFKKNPFNRDSNAIKHVAKNCRGVEKSRFDL